MAKSLSTINGNLTIPGAYSAYVVQANPSGLASTGILMLVGEADKGSVYSAESDLEETAKFGPDQAADVIAKYGSGPLVDAFLGAVSPSNDQEITGAFTAAILVKTNTSAKASAGLSFTDALTTASYGTLADKSYGKDGNLISYQVTANSSETLPTTGEFTYIPGIDPNGAGDDTFALGFRVNGAAKVTVTPFTYATPASFVGTVNALAGVGATGGANRNALTVAGTLAVDANPSGAGAYVVLITRSIAWAVQPAIGDTLLIPEGSPIAGASNVNVGAYVVTASSSASVTASKLSDYNKTTPAAAYGVVTAPADVSAATVLATTDLSAWAPVVISVDETSNAIQQGVGKSLEICELTSGNDLFTRYAYQKGTTTPVTWLSKAAGAKLLVSASEYKTALALALAQNGVSESLVAGGEIALKLSYAGTSGTVTISSTTLSTTVVGGAGTNLSVKLADYRTLTDLAAYINSLPGYKCTAGTSALGNLPPSALDRVTAKGIATEFGEYNGRLKVDAYRFFTTLSGSTLAQFGLTAPLARAALGLPDANATMAFLAGGSKGGTTDASFTAAVAACENVEGNFLVPLFSRDATLDIADALTDSTSTYTIDAINAACRSHVLAQSAYLVQKNRQAFVSLADTFVNQEQAASATGSFRVSMAFQDCKGQDSTGSIVTFLPWMTAVKAAAMQAAGGYRNIENKLMNISGFIQRAGDFNAKSDSQIKNALSAGLLPLRKDPSGGFIFVSDQTTYGRDDNFVFNSISNVYNADTVSRTLSKKANRAFTGKSLADTSANLAASFFEAVLSELLALKLIVPSDDAPKGFKSLKVRIVGNSMRVTLEIKLATALDFITIDFAITPVVQTAG